MSEIVFLVEDAAEGGLIARALGHSIFTVANTFDELRNNVRDAVQCHFGSDIVTKSELIRSTEEEKGQQIKNVDIFQKARNALKSDSLPVLQQTARDRKNVFAQLMEAVKYNSLGQISHALYDVGGEYRRNT